jgi:hypothetical protein
LGGGSGWAGGPNTYSCWSGEDGVGLSLKDQAIKPYICPSDFTNADGRKGAGSWGTTSYAYNYQIFLTDWTGYVNYPSVMQDGTSNTIMFAEKYGQPSADGWTVDWGGNAWWEWAPKFAYNGDIIGPNSKFLVKPTIKWCDANRAFSEAHGGSANICSLLATSSHTAGMNVGLGDGSVRFLSDGVSPATWWAAVTPAAGDILGNDW